MTRSRVTSPRRPGVHHDSYRRRPSFANFVRPAPSAEDPEEIERITLRVFGFPKGPFTIQALHSSRTAVDGWELLETLAYEREAWDRLDDRRFDLRSAGFDPKPTEYRVDMGGGWHDIDASIAPRGFRVAVPEPVSADGYWALVDDPGIAFQIVPPEAIDDRFLVVARPGRKTALVRCSITAPRVLKGWFGRAWEGLRELDRSGMAFVVEAAAVDSPTEPSLRLIDLHS